MPNIKIYCLLSLALLVGCTQSMQGRYTDQQICYRTRVAVDGWNLGYRAYGEGHFGPYANFMGLRREVQLTLRDRPDLYNAGNAQSCATRFPEFGAPLPQFYQAAQGVIPLPDFYRTILAGGTPRIPNQAAIDGNTLLLLGLVAAAGGAFAPPPPPTRYIFIM